MTQQISETVVANAISLVLIKTDEPISLLDVVKKAVPELAEESIKEFMNFLVNNKRVDDWSTLVSKNDDVKVIPCFAGGQ